jgi:hypothetical protein
MRTKFTCQGSAIFDRGRASSRNVFAHSVSSDQFDPEIMKTELISATKSKLDLGSKLNDLHDASSSLLSSSVVRVPSHTSSPSHFPVLPPIVEEMRFLRLIMKRSGVGFAYCALFACSFRARPCLEGFVT